MKIIHICGEDSCFAQEESLIEKLSELLDDSSENGDPYAPQSFLVGEQSK